MHFERLENPRSPSDLVQDGQKKTPELNTIEATATNANP